MNGYHCLNCGEKLKQIKNIIKRKIQRREKELKMLKSCLKIINDIKKGGE